MKTGLVFDPRFLAHDTGAESTVVTRYGTFDLSPQPHPSSLVITRRIKEFLDGTGLTARMVPIPTRPATHDELLYYHTPEYLQGIAAYANGGAASGPWGYADEETILCPASFDAALYAAGGALNAVSAVLEGTVQNAYALLRPPGHHATKNQALGFCVFNDAVLVAHHARTVYGLQRILIIDWDVHHGNGIQDAFYDDPGVLFFSLHQHNWFPELAGELQQSGHGPGLGFTVNIPLPPGTGDCGYSAAFAELIEPICHQFHPQLIIVVAGQDASWLDPLAHMMMTMAGFRHISERVMALATELCSGKLVMLQAGGYSAPYVPYCAVAGVEPLLGEDLGIVDLYATAPELKRCQTVFSQETRQALDDARQWHSQWWKL